MQKLNVEILFSIEQLEVIGISEAIFKYALLRRYLKHLVNKAIERRVRHAFLVDYPGFNLALAKELKKNNIQSHLVVSPQIWAWRPKRIHTIKKNITSILCLYDFEVEIYKKNNIPAFLMGHPVMNKISSYKKNVKESNAKMRPSVSSEAQVPYTAGAARPKHPYPPKGMNDVGKRYVTPAVKHRTYDAQFYTPTPGEDFMPQHEAQVPYTADAARPKHPYPPKGMNDVGKRYVTPAVKHRTYDAQFYTPTPGEATMRKPEDFVREHKQEKSTILLLPGSRRKEIDRLLPFMLQLAQKMEQSIPNINFLLACPEDDLLITQIKHYLHQKKSNKVRLMPGKIYDALSVSQAAIVCSGTASLECVLFGVPFLLLYKTSWLSYMVLRLLLTIPYIGIANVISSRFVHKEFIQKDIDIDIVFHETVDLIMDQNYQRKMIADFKTIENKITGKDAALEACNIICKILTKRVKFP